jgi:hypothetical protein
MNTLAVQNIFIVLTVNNRIRISTLDLRAGIIIEVQKASLLCTVSVANRFKHSSYNITPLVTKNTAAGRICYIESHGPDSRDSIPIRGKRFCSFPQCPDRLWSTPSLLDNGYRGSFIGCKAAEA